MRDFVPQIRAVAPGGPEAGSGDPGGGHRRPQCLVGGSGRADPKGLEGLAKGSGQKAAEMEICRPPRLTAAGYGRVPGRAWLEPSDEAEDGGRAVGLGVLGLETRR